ncbi:DUF5958 family protein [Streptomyces sp. NBC_01515]|uniref:DUF5958 family protein n=1 Tax=Streptomyces sp. NBC_01515 TaxID=2903890 RepID=UPI00386AAD32
MDERTVKLNELARGLRPLVQGVEWFEGLAAAEQFEVLRDLGGFCVQARATLEDGPESVRLAGIRPTHGRRRERFCAEGCTHAWHQLVRKAGPMDSG